MKGSYLRSCVQVNTPRGSTYGLVTDEKTIEGLVRTSELFNVYLNTPLALTDVNAVKAQLTSGWQEELRGKQLLLFGKIRDSLYLK